MILAAFIFAVVALGFAGAAVVVKLIVTDMIDGVREVRRRARRNVRGFEVLPPAPAPATAAPAGETR